MIRSAMIVVVTLGWGLILADLAPAEPPGIDAHLEMPSPGSTKAHPQALQMRAIQRGTVINMGRFTSYQVNVDAFGNDVIGDAANEPSIAVDPTDPSRMAIGWREFATLTSPGAFRQAGNAHSSDGGVNWTNPGPINPTQFSSDPVLASDAAGNFYYSALQTQRNTTDCVISPANGIYWSIFNYKSFDGGATWPQDVFAYGGDKQWIAVDTTAGIGADNLYMLSSPNPGAICIPGGTFTRSTDGGLTYDFPTSLPQSQFSGTLTVGPDGAVYTIGSGFTGFPQPFNVSRSSNAQDPLQVPVFEMSSVVDLDGFRVFGTGPNPGGLLGQAQIVTDHSNALTHGNVYALSTATRLSVSDPADVMFARSEDRGETWSPPVRINTDSLGAWQWFGTIGVAPNGRIDVAWLDTRNDATPGVPTLSELFYTFSLDGGDTWSAPEIVSPQFNHFLGYPGQNKMGDYFDMVSDNGGGHLAWAGTFNGGQDVYYTYLTPDCNGNGVADIDDIDILTSDDCNQNLIPDECEQNFDCNTNGTQDICDVFAGTSDDCNSNFIPDECESQEDCNSNTIQDVCDTASGFSDDCNQNEVPDECEPGPDCNGNGTLDVCDIAVGGEESDCNDNGIPDSCDIDSGFSDDLDLDGIPDECVGACCLCSSCIITSETSCTNQSGLFNGIGTACTSEICDLTPNDECESAEVLTGELTAVREFSNACANTDGPTNENCDTGLQPIGADLWYEYEAPCCGTLTVSLCNDTLFDAALAIYGGTETCACPSGADGTALACGDDSCGSPAGPGIVSVPAQNGDCFTIRVGGWLGTLGDGAVELTMSCIPSGGPVTAYTHGHWDLDVGTFTQSGAFADLAADGDIVYLAQILDNKVHFIDISNPEAPTRFLEWVVPGPNGGASAEDVKVADGLLFVSLFGDLGNDGVEIVDVRDPFNPLHLTFITIPGFEDVKNTFYASGYLYLANGTTPDIAVVDLTAYDPDAPPAQIVSALHTFSVGTSFVEDVFVQDGLLYAAAWNDGAFIFDVSAIALIAPVLIADGPDNAATHSAVPSENGNWMIATEEAAGGALRLYEVVNSEGAISLVSRQAITTTAASSFHQPAIAGTRVYVASYEAGVQVYDLDAAGAQLVPIGSYASYFQGTFGAFVGAYGVDVSQGADRMLVSDIASGLHIVEMLETTASISYPSGMPELIHPDDGATLDVQIDGTCEEVVPETASLFVSNRDLGGGFVEIPLTALGGSSYAADFPSDGCGSLTDWYVRAETLGGAAVFDPPGAPLHTYTTPVARFAPPVLIDDFESDLGWTTADDICGGATGVGAWQRLDPNGTPIAPENDSPFDAGAQCYVTSDAGPGGNYFSNDIDGGPFRIVSPSIALGGTDAIISWDWLFYSINLNVARNDLLTLEVSDDGGTNWMQIAGKRSAALSWEQRSIRLSDVLTPPDELMLRFIASDCPNGKLTEAAVDNVRVRQLVCSDCVPAPAPLAEEVPIRRNRFVHVNPSNAGSETGLRVTFDELQRPDPPDVAADFAAFEGETRWVGPPTQYDDAGTPFFAAELQCEPHFRDWSDIDELYVYGAGIVPSSTYSLQAVDATCSSVLGLESAYSPAISVRTARWGDVVDPFQPPSEFDQPNIGDILALVDNFLGFGPPRVQVNLKGDVVDPSQKLDINDILACVDAFLGEAYPYSGPTSCP